MQRFETSTRTYRGTPCTVVKKLPSREKADAQRKAITFLLASKQTDLDTPSLVHVGLPTPVTADEPDNKLPAILGADEFETDIAPASPPQTPVRLRAPIVKLQKSWTKAISELGFHSVGFYGPTEPVSRALGDPIGGRPIYPSLSATWKPSLIAQIDRLSPFVHQDLLFRFWFINEAEAERFYKELSRFLSSKGDPVRGQWFDVGAHTDMSALQSEILKLAARLGLRTLSDHEVLQLARQYAERGHAN